MSRIDLSEDHRETLCELLTTAFATTADLGSQVRQARWLIRRDVAASSLLAEIHEQLQPIGDRLLHRVMALGGVPDATLRGIVDSSILPPYDVPLGSASAHLEALADRFEVLAASLRRNVDMTGQLEDPITAFVFAGVSEAVEAAMGRLDRASA
ncbi:MAG: starvation-inducible DNA-binding protein [Bradymonadia bacterium]|jgi:starvation-inducible DNA-binding protein